MEGEGVMGVSVPILTKEQSVCLAGMVALSLPLRDQALGAWNHHLLLTVVELLGLKKDHVEALRPLIHAEGNDPTIRRLQMTAFMRAYTPTDDSAGAERIRQLEERYQRLRYIALRNLVVLLASKSIYDARTRMVVRRLADSMGVPWCKLAAIESLTATDLHDIWEASKAKDKVHKGWRYAKIGAAAVGGGALLALTGGLAAPAIAVGLTAMGTTTAAVAASYATTTAVATLFGASGAGLVGYKVGRRTEGVKSFEFKGHNKGEPTKMVVCICISGWLVQDESEFQVPWGVEPDVEYVAARLRLFYKLHNPDNVKHAAVLEAEYEGRLKELDRKCRERYQASPFAERLVPWKQNELAAVGEEERAEVAGIIIRERPETDNKKKKEKKKKEGKPRRRLWGSGQLSMEEEEEEDGEEDEGFEGVDVEALRQDLERVRSVVDMASPGRGGKAKEAPRSPASRSDSGSPRAPSHPPSTLGQPRPPIIKPARSCEEEMVEEDPTPSGSSLSGGVSFEEGEGGPLLKVEQAEEEEDLTAADKMLSKEKDVQLPWWNDELPFWDQYTLHWEPGLLLDLGNSVMELVASVGQQAALEVLTYTAAATLVSALAWPLAIVQAADYIDGTWTVCCDRADRAGKILAELLMKREHGTRPVVLMGYSMGARMIVSCLLELVRVHKEWEEQQKKKGGEAQEGVIKGSPAAGVVQMVVLMGTPMAYEEKAWASFRTVVTDRVIHCYSKRDMVLAVLYRYNKLAVRVCGNRAINVPGIQNVDASHIIGGHQEYATKIRDVLRLCGLEDSASRYRFPRSSSSVYQRGDSAEPEPAADARGAPLKSCSSSSSMIDEYFGETVEGEKQGGGLLKSAFSKLSMTIQKIGDKLMDEGGEGRAEGEEDGEATEDGQQALTGEGGTRTGGRRLQGADSFEVDTTSLY